MTKINVESIFFWGGGGSLTLIETLQCGQKKLSQHTQKLRWVDLQVKLVEQDQYYQIYNFWVLRLVETFLCECKTPLANPGDV